MQQSPYIIQPNRHEGIPYHKQNTLQHLEYHHSLTPDMRSYDYDKLRKTDYPIGFKVKCSGAEGIIINKDWYNYLIDLGKGNWRWLSENEFTTS